MKRLIFLLILVSGLGALAYWLWEPLPPVPTAEVLTAGAFGYDVEIVRDEWGVPHVFGDTDADASFGLAYAHAEDDFETIQEVVAATRGTLARYRGPEAAPTDYIVSLMGVWDTIETRYEPDVPEDVKAIAEAYAAGLNLYAAQNRDDTWRGLAPFTAEDVVAGFIFKTPFFYGLDDTLAELFADARNTDTPFGESGGSNAFAVAPQRSADGKTRLLINSHQPMTGPVAWYEAHIHSDEGLDIMGGVFPGTPMILHGFNRHLGWANTVSKPDLVDVYRLEVDPDNSDQYRLDGQWVPFEVETVEIGVKLIGPFVFNVRQELKHSRHGPVIEAPHGTYAIRYAGRGEIRQLEQYYRLNQAEDWDSFMDAMSLHALPSINYVYADKSGTIAFVHNGQYPERFPGWNWQGDLPGTRADLIWEDYLPYSATPILKDPVSGLVFNANNTPFDATDGPDELSPARFPSEMGLQVNDTNRSLRIGELTDGVTPLSRAALLAIKFDDDYSRASPAFDVVQAVLAEDWSRNADLAAAAIHLAEWDGSMHASSRHAALAGLTIMDELTTQFTGIPPRRPAKAFEQSVWLLLDNHGRIDPEWGEVNRLVRGSVNLPIDGGPDTLRAIYPGEIQDDVTLHATAGDTWIALVEWDDAGAITADVIHNFGSATLDDSSPHYADQAPLFAAKQWRRAEFDEDRLRATSSDTYRPQGGLN